MNILEKLDLTISTINESGIQNMSKIAKEYKKATIYFHMDLDGVTSACGLKAYLTGYGIKVVNAFPIQYGDLQYSVPLPEEGTLACLVDFAHGKPVMKIWTDHHDKDHLGVLTGMSTSFVKTPSNASYISQTISPSDLFPQEDLKIIDMVDSAKFVDYGVTVDQVMNAVFGYDKTLDVTKNRMLMGMVCNKLLLTFKNKKNFLATLVMRSSPSLVSIYNNIVKLAKSEGYASPQDIKKNSETYIKNITRSDKIKVYGNLIFQDDKPADMFKPGSYDRYSIFKVYPDAHYLLTYWSIGLIQLSKNPFQKGKNPLHLGQVCDKIMEGYKQAFSNIKISFGEIKEFFEKKGNAESMGFTYNDFVNMFKEKAEEIGKEKAWSFKEALKNVGKKRYVDLPDVQKKFLDEVTVSAWDIIKAESGGHKDITNIQGLAFVPEKFHREIIKDIIKEMKDKRLE